MKLQPGSLTPVAGLNEAGYIFNVGRKARPATVNYPRQKPR
ncbi:MAG TPA: hypothetical protein VNW30_03605 [Opitutaceae bacterium]|jgi:hypothetical protein|nr:hypothetical protein [Opitutaceae bacterium]